MILMRSARLPWPSRKTCTVCQASFARHCTGVWLGGGAAQQTLWDFAPLPYRELAAPEKPGVGLVPPAAGHGCQKILIPQAKG